MRLFKSHKMKIWHLKEQDTSQHSNLEFLILKVVRMKREGILKLGKRTEGKALCLKDLFRRKVKGRNLGSKMQELTQYSVEIT